MTTTTVVLLFNSQSENRPLIVLHHPSEYEWLHTADTVVKEWQGHNMWYYWLRPFGKLGLFADAIESARHVDLDNDDVGKGFWGLLG